jgi:hypothetical protein
MEFKDLWDLESALQVLGHKTVDSKLWAEAVEWLLHYGPPEIRQLLLDASETAMHTAFPELKPSHYTHDGQPCYDVNALARSMGVEEKVILEILKQKEQDKNRDRAWNDLTEKGKHIIH